MARLPGHHALESRGIRDQRRDVPGTTRGLAYIEITTADGSYHVQNIAAPITAPITAVQRLRRTAVIEIAQGGEMRRGEVFDMNVVADTRAIRRVIVGTEDRHVVPQPARGLAGDLNQVGGGRRRLSEPAVGPGAGDVKIPQRDVPESTAGRLL